MEKVGHEGSTILRAWKKSTILRRTICEGNMEKVRGKHGKSWPLEGSTILRRTICEGNMEKVGLRAHLRETWKKWAT